MKIAVRRAISTLPLVLLAIRASVPVVSADETVPWAFWYSSNPAEGVLRLSDEPIPQSVFLLPHASALGWDQYVPGSLRLGAAGAAVIPPTTDTKGYGGGGSIALTGLGDRFLWSAGAGISGGEDRSSGRLVGSLARPVAARMVAGAGVHLSLLNTRDHGTEPSVALDIGVARSFGASRGPGRVTAHAALLDIGPESLREAFTPLIGLDSTVWSDGDARVDASLAAMGRSSETITLGGAVSFSWRERLELTTAVPFLQGDSVFPAIPSLRLDVTVPLGERNNRTGAGLFVVPSDGAGTVVGFDAHTVIVSRTEEPPEIAVRTEAPIPDVVSPHGEYRVVAATVEARDDRAMGFLELRVEDGDGRVLRTTSVYPAGPDWGAMTLSDRLSRRLRSDLVQGDLVWNAAPDEEDGTFLFVAHSADAAGNRSRREIATVTVDATPPEISGRFTAHGGDGTELEDLRLAASGEVSGEVTLRGADRSRFVVIDQASRPVRELIPEALDGNGYRLSWNGSGDDGYRVANGVYRIRTEATDAAGNRSSLESEEITVRGRTPEMSIAVSSHVMTGEGAGSSQAIVVIPRLEPATGLRDWTIDLVGADGEVIRSWSGIDLLPEEIRLDGEGFPADGEYRIAGRAVYLDGETAFSESGTIVVDQTPPSVAVAAARTRVRRGIDAAIPIFVETGPDVARTEVVLYRDGDEMRRISSGRPSPTLELPLADSAGRPLSAGTYTIGVLAQDRYGNVARPTPLELEVLPGDIDAQIILDHRVFSPNDDGRQDYVSVYATVSEDRSLDEYTLVIQDGAGEDVTRRSGAGVPPPTIVWDGRDARGGLIQDGRYSLVLEARYADGTTVASNRETVTVDTSVDAPELELEGATISPDGDGRLDELVIRVGPVDSDVVERYLVVERNGADLARRAVEPPGTIRWIPRGTTNLPIPDGEYRLYAEVADEAGNTIRGEALPFAVITRPVTAYLSVSQPHLSPNGDDLDEEITIRPVVPEPSGMVRWSLIIASRETGRVLRRFSGDGETLPENLRWDGIGETGALAEDGHYLARLEAEWEWGARVDVESVPFVLDGTPPDLDVRVHPRRFSPDDDGVDDRLFFDVELHDISPIQFWYLEVLDPRGRFFYDDGGSGAPPRRIFWDGYARNGERVVSAAEYRWSLQVVDELGNETVVEGAIETDVLVERTDRGYRIQVPGITFLPDSAELVLDSGRPEGQRNITVLDRIVEIFERYPDYAVIVEGHAVNVTGTDREQREELLPLSLARARSVRDALVERGVPARRLEATGRGGAVPIVPHGDVENRWKNRRVEFLLVR